MNNFGLSSKKTKIFAFLRRYRLNLRVARAKISGCFVGEQHLKSSFSNSRGVGAGRGGASGWLCCIQIQTFYYFILFVYKRLDWLALVNCLMPSVLFFNFENGSAH